MTLEQALGLYNYWVVVILMMTGFYMVIARRNLVKSILGLNIFQTSVFLLYITMGKVNGATAPIVPPEIAAQHAAGHGHDDANHHDGHAESVHDVVGNSPHDAAGEHASSLLESLQVTDLSYTGMKHVGADEIVYSNPLPSVLMLTAIVVGIATTALALALIVRVREEYGTIEEDEIMELDRAS